MSLSLDRMRSLVRKGLGGQSSSELNDNEVDELLNMALWEIEDRFDFKAKEARDTITLVSGTRSYDLSTELTRLDALRSIAVVLTTGKRQKLARTTRDNYDTMYDSSDNVEATPTHYFREGDTLYVWPTPGDNIAGQDLELSFKQSVASFSEGDDVTQSGLPRSWDEIVVTGAIMKGHFFNEDYNFYREARSIWSDLVRTAITTTSKEEEDSRYARLNVLWDAPPEH